jgi:hypothetical protein
MELREKPGSSRSASMATSAAAQVAADNAFFEPFYTTNDRFTKTGSGKNIRKLINRPFSRRLPPAPRRRQELCEEVRMRSHPSIHLWMMMMMMHATRL